MQVREVLRSKLWLLVFFNTLHHCHSLRIVFLTLKLVRNLVKLRSQKSKLYKIYLELQSNHEKMTKLESNSTEIFPMEQQIMSTLSKQFKKY